MKERLLRRREVEEISGLSRASIYRLMRGGSFPLPVRVSAVAVRWKESDIRTWMRTRPLATEKVGMAKAAGTTSATSGSDCS